MGTTLYCYNGGPGPVGPRTCEASESQEGNVGWDVRIYRLKMTDGSDLYLVICDGDDSNWTHPELVTWFLNGKIG